MRHTKTTHFLEPVNEYHTIEQLMLVKPKAKHHGCLFLHHSRQKWQGTTI